MGYRFALKFTAWNPKGKEMPFDTQAAIYVKTFTSDEDDRVFVTPQDCVTADEIDWWVRELTTELKRLAAQARRKFAAQEKRERAARRRGA